MNRLIDGVQETACIGYADVKAKRADGEEFGGYSLGFHAPKEDGEDSWFGHGGAWGTNCRVNWHKKQLKFWAVQFVRGSPLPWEEDRDAAADKFFNQAINNSEADAYTGRLK